MQFEGNRKRTIITRAENLRLFIFWVEVLNLCRLSAPDTVKWPQTENRKTVSFLLNDPQSNKSKIFVHLIPPTS